MSTTPADPAPAITPAKARASPVESDTASRSSRGTKRGRTPVSQQDAVLRAAFVQASVRCQELGWNGLASLLNNSPQIPSIAQVQAAAKKALADSPPWVHWSKVDAAAQLKCVDTARCVLASATMRGYRMARASHGVATPTEGGEVAYYYECKIRPGPTAQEIRQAFPPHVRLGPGLKESLEKALEWEAAQDKITHNSNLKVDDMDEEGAKRKPEDATAPPAVGGHVRLGFSMRTGDLQGPVGYDKWSYGIRDIGGSILHKSQRQDSWGGVGFGPGDVVGCAIVLHPKHNSENNHIRFFKNGKCMGHFVIAKGKRVGGEAFINLENGVYYPAVSTYLGGSVEANFGPHFIYPPRKLPAGLKFRPFSDLCPTPVATNELRIKLLDKAAQAELNEAALAEAAIVMDACRERRLAQLEYVRKERTERGISLQGLPDNDNVMAEAPSTAPSVE